MAWGIKTKSDGKFYPILYIKNFEMADKNTDGGSGELVLTSCNLVLDGFGTGIQSGGVKIEGDPSGSGLYFYDANDASKSYMMIFPENVLGESSVNILDKIQFYKNQAGTNTLKLGDNTNFIYMTDDGNLTSENGVVIIENGSFNCWGGSVILGTDSNRVDFSVYPKSAYIWGDLRVEGNVHANNISSDRRIKNNIEDSTKSALDIIKKIKHKQFDRKDDGKHYDIGYIAQEMEEIDKNFVLISPATKQAEERYYINELPILATLSKAIQEQQEIIEQLQEKIKEMEDKLNG